MNDQYASWTQGPAPRRRALRRLPPAARLSWPKYLAKALERLPPLEGVHAAGLPRADPDQAAERGDPSGELPALSRRLRARHAGRGRPRAGGRRSAASTATAASATARADDTRSIDDDRRRDTAVRRAPRGRRDRRGRWARPLASAFAVGRAADQHLPAQAGGEEPVPPPRRGHRGDDRSGAVGDELAARSTTATGAPRRDRARGSAAPRRCPTRRSSAIRGSSGCSPATRSRSTTATGAVTPTCSPTRSRPSA